jgi:uncharacterized SAM-binding protein YcdF (DUF218 family)
MNLLNSVLVFPSKWWLFILGLGLLLLILVFVAGEPTLHAIGNFLVVKDDSLQPADVIHILGSSYQRVDYGVELYHRGFAPRLFITGCDRTIYKERAMAGGVRPEDLAPGLSWSTTTYEEALELKEFLDQAPSMRSVIVVSDPYHMRRAQWSFNKVLGDRVELQFAPVLTEMTSYQKRWWTEARLRKSVVKEYLGILLYYVRYSLL